MARKLSRIAKHGCLLWAASGILSAASSAQAQNDVQISLPPQTVIQNPFAKGVKPQPVVVPDEPQSPRRMPTTYHNPFAMRSTAPPINLLQRSGSISRWQRLPILPEDPSPVRNAILSGDRPQSVRMRWDQLSADDVRGATLAPAETQAAELSLPPDPIQFAPRQLQQPAWLTLDFTTIEQLPGSNQGASAREASFDLPLSAPRNPERGEANSDSFVAAASGRPGHALEHVKSAGADLISVIVSDSIDSPTGWLLQAEKAAQSARSVDQFDSVIEFCERGLSAKPEPEVAAAIHQLGAWACNRRGELFIDGGQPQEALHDFQTAISWDPSCSLAIHNRAVTLAEQHQLADALRDFNRVIELNPGLAVAYRNRGELLASLGRTEESVRDYTQALEQLPDDAALLRARGEAFQRIGDYDRALADLNSAVRLTPNQPEAYAQRGNLHAEHGEFDRALADFQRALDANPGCIEAYRGLAWLQSTCPNPRFRNAEIALEAASRAVKLAPTDDSFLLDALAAAHANAEHYDEAARVLERAIAIAPLDFAPQLRERLELYQQNRPYRSGSAPAAVRTASHEASSSRPSPAVRQLPKAAGGNR